MPDRGSLATSSVQDPEKADHSRLTPSTIESKELSMSTAATEKPGTEALSPKDEQLQDGPRIVEEQDQTPAPKRILRGLTVLWRKFTSKSIGPSSNFEGSTVEYDSDGSAPARWYISALDTENSQGGLDIVVEDGSFSLEGAVEPSDSAQASSNGKNQQKGSSGEASAHASDLGYLSSAPSYLSYLSRLKWSVQHFFVPTFEDAQQEKVFQKEAWASRKRLAICFSIYLLINYILYLTLNDDLASIFSRITFFGAATVLTVPLPFLLAFDAPVKHPILFQLYFTCAVWIWGLSEMIQSRVCGYWPHSTPCNGKNFLLLVFFATGYPTLALYVVQTRVFAALGAVTGFILINIFILPISSDFSRVLIAYTLYHAFIIATHWVHESTERRMFRLNLQLKTAYRAQQRAQVKESEAASSKRRFVSYIFHEVRVPLNTALLSFQNLQNNSAFRENTDNELELHALEGSLTMMGKVLNDVLDLNRMNAGKFESCDKPFPLHRAMQTTLGGLGIATAAKRIQLNVQLDPAIDALAQGVVAEGQASGVWLKGDDMRLIQVLTNLASNACKFTPPGGHITLSTHLLRVQTPAAIFTSTSPGALENGFGSSQSEYLGRRRVIVRFEVKDTGPGISLSEIQAQTLFTPFVQTAAGKASGKGSGLGLSIVRQIVKLSGGRVGVISKPGEGSTFWFELAFWTASPSEIASSVEWKSVPAVNERRSSQGSGEDGASTAPKPSPIEKAMRPVLDRLVSFDTSLKATTGIPHLMPSPQESSRPTYDHSLQVQAEVLGDRSRMKLSSPSESMSVTSYAPQPSANLSECSSSRPLLASGSNSSFSLPPSSARPRQGSFAMHVSPVPTVEEASASTVLDGSRQETPRPSHSENEPAKPAENELRPPIAAGQSNSCPALPVSASLPTDPSPQPSTSANASIDRPLNVLIVDDDGLTRKLMSRMLQRQGCNISTAEDGQYALDLLLEPEPHYFDCIFLDNQMPRKTGLDVVRELRDAGRTEPVIGVTGNALREDQEGYLKAGADHVLIKPVMAGDLTKMLESARQRLA